MTRLHGGGGVGGAGGEADGGGEKRREKKTAVKHKALNLEVEQTRPTPNKDASEQHLLVYIPPKSNHCANNS